MWMQELYGTRWRMIHVESLAPVYKSIIKFVGSVNVITDVVYYLQWIQESNTPCQQSVQVCWFPLGPQNNWLITQLINRTVNGTKLPQISVTMEYEIQDCNMTLSCQRTFNAHIYETSIENADAAKNISNYQQVRKISLVKITSKKEKCDYCFYTQHGSFIFLSCHSR